MAIGGTLIKECTGADGKVHIALAHLDEIEPGAQLISSTQDLTPIEAMRNTRPHSPTMGTSV